MKLTLPEPPSANRYWRHAKGRTYLSADALAYRDTVAVAWAEHRLRDRKTFRRMRGPIALTYAWYRKIASGDLDNRTKQLCDSLRGYAYEDDSQIIEIHAYRYDNPKSGQVVVTIEAAPQQKES